MCPETLQNLDEEMEGGGGDKVQSAFLTAIILLRSFVNCILSKSTNHLSLMQSFYDLFRRSAVFQQKELRV
jgi:hypothetical protein